MTNLTVFQDISGDLYIQISSPQLRLSQILFVAASDTDTAANYGASPAETLKVRLEGKILVVYFMIVASVRAELVQARFEQVGQLAETDSINVLNHIVDILAYP